MLQRLDPRAVWVYGLRCRGEAHQDMQKVFSSAVVGSACSAEVLALIFIHLNIFNRDLYKPKTSPHFLLSFQTDIESHSPARGVESHRLLKAVCKCLLCLVERHKTTQPNEFLRCFSEQRLPDIFAKMIILLITSLFSKIDFFQIRFPVKLGETSNSHRYIEDSRGSLPCLTFIK